jgi:hypothetical protein
MGGIAATAPAFTAARACAAWLRALRTRPPGARAFAMAKASA